MGIGYTWVLVAISLVRELLGSGKIFGVEVFAEENAIGFFSGASGGFFVFGIMIALTLGLSEMKKKKPAVKVNAEKESAKNDGATAVITMDDGSCRALFFLGGGNLDNVFSLNDLSAAHFKSFVCNKGIQRHILRFKRRDAVSVLVKNTA